MRTDFTNLSSVGLLAPCQPLSAMDCGGKRSATPLWLVRRSGWNICLPAKSKAPSSPGCRRTPRSHHTGRQVPLHQSFGNRITGEPGHVMNIKLVHDLLPVFFDGFDADCQLPGDLLV